MNETDVSITDLTKIVGDLEIPCDYGQKGYCYTRGEHTDPARWVMHLVRCGCGAGGIRLACTQCKDERMQMAIALECGGCGEIHPSCSTAYSLIEPLEKR